MNRLLGFFISLLFVVIVAIAANKVPVGDSSFYSLSKAQFIEASQLKSQEQADTGLAHVHQASLFQHPNQQNVDYVFSIILALFLAAAISFRQQPKKILFSPWFIHKRMRSRFIVQGWQSSNSQYKTLSISPKKLLS